MDKKVDFIADPDHQKYNVHDHSLTTAYKAVISEMYNVPYIPYMPHQLLLMFNLEGDEYKYFHSCLTYGIVYGKFNEVIEITIDRFLINILKTTGVLDNLDESKYSKVIGTYMGRLVKKGAIKRKNRGIYYFNPLYVAKCVPDLNARLKLLHDYESKQGIISFDDSELKTIKTWINDL